MASDTTERARALFDGIAGRYQQPAAVLSLGQYGRWRRALVDAMALPRGARVLDVATGTGLIARDVEARVGRAVVGLDQSDGMLAEARRRGRPTLTGGTADRLPFGDAAFDAVIFSYLLRYVPDPAATLRELARVLRPGGMLGSVEFGVPAGRLTGPGWRAYALRVMPLLAAPLSPGWRQVGSFLGPNILAWDAAWPVERQRAAWHAAGLQQIRVQRLTFGAGIVMTGRKHGDAA